MSLSFARPEWLLALPAMLVMLWWAARESYADLHGHRLIVAWVVRVALVTVLVLALAGTEIVRPARELAVVFAVDASHSVPEAERERVLELVRQSLRHRGGEHTCAMVVFGRRAMLEAERLSRTEDVTIASEVGAGHTDIAAGLRLALGVIPPETAGRVVLCSDGNANVGAAEEQVLAASAARVSVDVLPLATREAADALVADVGVPSQARRDEPFRVRAQVRTTEPTEGTLTVLVDDEPVETRSVTLGAGTRSFAIPVSIADAGFHRVDVLLDAEDGFAENDVGTGFVRVRGEPRVLVADANPEEAASLRRALQLQEIDVKVGGAASIPTSAADLEDFDAVFLSDFPSYAMTYQQMVMLRDAVRDRGMGLGMIGGELSFGAGGYYDSPVEEALPVSMDVTKQRSFPAAAVLIVMDTSGSMGMPEDGYTKIELAAEAGCAIVDLLQPYDSVGFIASDPAPTEVAPLRTLENREGIKADIRSVRAGGGGISVYPSLDAAHGVLANDDSAVRHIILLADGSDCDHQQGSVPLVQQMAGEGISVTSVAFGDGPHVPFLKDVAAAGGGQFYLTERARDLKGIFTREALKVAKSVLVEDTFRPRQAEASELTAGFDWSGAPPLMGYVATSRRELASTALVSHRGDPVLAHWQFGLGRSVAFTSDAKAHWAAHWLRWGQFPRFWGQTVRWVLRRPDSGLLHPRVERGEDGRRLVVEAIAEDGSPINGLDMRATLTLPGGESEELSLPQSASGVYSAPLEAARSGAYLATITARGPDGFEAERRAGFAVPYPPDYADMRADEAFLRRVARQTGGRVVERPEQVFEPPQVYPATHTEIWRSLLWLAALLLPLDVAVRRLIVRAEDLAPAAEAVRGVLARLRSGRAEEPATVGHLLQARRQAREGREEGDVQAPLPQQVRGARETPDEAYEQASGAAEEGAPAPSDAEVPARGEEDEEEPAATTARLLRRKRELREED